MGFLRGGRGYRRNGFDIGDIQMEAVMQRKHLALHAKG